MSDIAKGQLDQGGAMALDGERLRVRPSAFGELRPGFKMRVRKPQKSSLLLMAIFAAIALFYAGNSIFPSSYDNDIWFILANGEYITQHGIPYTNPFSIQQNMGIVIQQWLPSVIMYTIYHAAGFVGLGVYVTALFLLFAASLLFIFHTLRGNDSGGEVLMVLVLLCLVAASPYTTVRPHLYSMLAYSWIVWFCVKYARTSDARYLIALPLICVVHVNCHAALAPLDLGIIFCFVLPDVLKPFHKRGHLERVQLVEQAYPRISLLITLAICAVALLVNPYGIQGALYVFLSFGAASYKNHINEMQGFTPSSGYETAITTALLLFAIFVMGRKGLKSINLPLTLLALAGTVAAMMYVRNMWLGAVFCSAYLAWAAKGIGFPFLAEVKWAKAASAVILVAGVCAMSDSMTVRAPELASYPHDGESTPVNTVNYLDGLGVDKENTRVFTHFNAGGYLEYNGFKVNVDPRPELWNSRISGQDFNFYYEYVDMATGDFAFELYNKRYDFDVFICAKGMALDEYFTKKDKKYVEIQGGNGYRAYAKRSWIEQYRSDQS